MKFTARLLTAATLEVKDNDPGLMTWAEFQKFQNESGKIHEEGAYDWSIEEMNRVNRNWVGYGGTHKDKINAYQYEKGWGFTLEGRDAELIAVSDGHTCWVRHPFTKMPKDYWVNGRKTEVESGTPKVVKYPQEYLDKIATPVAEKEYPKVIQNMGDYTLRASMDPSEKSSRFKLGLFHGKLLVAVAQDEWGATLISVAQEYRGRNLGPVMRKYWGKFRPDYTSGGYTYAGRYQARKVWSNRVRELMAHGVYSKMIRDGKMTKERYQAILADARKSTETVGQAPSAPEGRKESGKLLLLVDEYQFILYDPQFYEDQEDFHIKAFGFLRDSEHVGTFFFKLDYDYQYRGIANAVALQLARDLGEPLYIGEGYADMLEPEGLPTKTEGNHIQLTQNVLDIKSQSRKEKAYRKAHDPHQENYYALLEAANGKDWNQ